MKVKDLITIPALKPRDPNQRVLASKRNAGGAMRDKSKEAERGKFKHKARMYEDEVLEAKDKKPKPAKAEPIPKMGVHGVRVSMQEGWRDRMTHAIKKLGYHIVGQGYTHGSTHWDVTFEIDKKFHKKEFEDKLRDELNYGGYISVEFHDLEETE